MNSQQKDPPWKRDELILALDLYVKKKGTPDKGDPDVISLSSLLQKLPIHPKEIRTEKFRNPNSIAMKCGNFQYLDEEVPGGLSAGSKLDRKIWDEFQNDQSRLQLLAENLRKIAISDPNFLEDLSETVGSDEAENSEVTEGETFYRLHRYKERNSAIVKKKKKDVLEKEGHLKCEVCNFDFKSHYGELGDGYIECHHAKPLYELQAGETTRLQDLALVCSNCHRMIHRKGTISIEDLKENMSF